MHESWLKSECAVSTKSFCSSERHHVISHKNPKISKFSWTTQGVSSSLYLDYENLSIDLCCPEIKSPIWHVKTNHFSSFFNFSLLQYVRWIFLFLKTRSFISEVFICKINLTFLCFRTVFKGNLHDNHEKWLTNGNQFKYY